MDHLGKVLQKLQENKFFASPEKFSFFASKVVFLGFVISEEGILMDPEKVKTIIKWSYPENITQLRKFLGHANLYR